MTCKLIFRLATGGEATDSTADDIATGEDTAQEGETAAATGGNATGNNSENV